MTTVKRFLPCLCVQGPLPCGPDGECLVCKGTLKVELGTSVRRNVDGELKETLCQCADPGMSPQSCALKSGNKTDCRCDCHRIKRGEMVKREKQ